MAKDIKPRFTLKSVDDIFSTQEMRDEEKLERVREIAPDELSPFKNHPFKVQMDEETEMLCTSIKDYGILTPLMARPLEDGGYELVSGHRRKATAEVLGIEKLPVLVRDMTDDEAIILMVDSNIQRENLLPSEKAFAYKMKLEAMKRKAGRPAKNACQVGTNLRSDIELAKSSSDSARTIQRYIRLTELAPPLLEMVDNKKIAFSPAVELSYLTKEEQADLWELIQSEGCTPSLSQAVRMKKLSQDVKLTPRVIFSIMSEEKTNQKEKLKLPMDNLRKYFPKRYTPEEIEAEIMRMLEDRYKRRQNDMAER